MKYIATIVSLLLISACSYKFGDSRFDYTHLIPKTIPVGKEEFEAQGQNDDYLEFSDEDLLNNVELPEEEPKRGWWG